MVQTLTITKSESFNHYQGHSPDKAHDGQYDTFYSVKDGAVAGNYLKLYLREAYSITRVQLTSRRNMVQRMVNTEVWVYSTTSDIRVASCGRIEGEQEEHWNRNKFS